MPRQTDGGPDHADHLQGGRLTGFLGQVVRHWFHRPGGWGYGRGGLRPTGRPVVDRGLPHSKLLLITVGVGGVGGVPGRQTQSLLEALAVRRWHITRPGSLRTARTRP